MRTKLLFFFTIFLPLAKSGECFEHSMEVINVLLVIQNIVSDIILLLEMKSTKQDYENTIAYLDDEPGGYDFEFCYPDGFVPKWYNNTSSNTECDCITNQINCLNATNNNLNQEISCTPQFYGKGQSCQSVILFENWVCNNCNCSSQLHSSVSLPVIRYEYEYNTTIMLGDQYAYCDPYSIQNKKLANNNLQTLINCSIAFIVIGTIFSFVAVCGRWAVVKEEAPGTRDGEKYRYSKRLNIFLARIAASFVANTFHDVPNQIVLLFYLRFLYSDYGYECFHNYYIYPKLHLTTFNGEESALVIFARNWKILYSVVAHIILVFFNSGYQLYAFCQEESNAMAIEDTDSLQHKLINEVDHDIFGSVCFYFILFIAWFVYLFSHWCWPAFVGYYYIASAFHHEWIALFAVFIIGLCAWGILILVIIVLGVSICRDKYC